MTESKARQAVVSEARTWLRTPYHHMGRVKGAGCDCAMFPAEVYAAAGVIPPIVGVDYYPEQWNLHRDAERYLDVVLRYAREVAAPTGPGDFVLWRWGRTLSHGAIVIAWPTIIHSVKPEGVRLDDALRNARLANRDRERRVFTLW
jgi:cell wall-associated NlpC family hydrolase